MDWLKKRFTKRFWFGVGICLAFLLLAYNLWQPGLTVQNGRDNRNQNALWMGHGWLGGDSWFKSNHRTNQQSFRAPASIQKLAALCVTNGISDVYPHLCPTQTDGSIADWDDAQVERFLDNTPRLRVMPWIGGRLDGGAQIGSKNWRAKFIASIKKLFRLHPRLAGVHLNFEPWKNGDKDALVMLDNVRASLPPGKQLSISAYPPPDWFYPLKRSWSETYFKQVADRCDQMTLMAYDSSVQNAKLFQWLVARWTRNTVAWTANNSRKTRVLVGVPTYDAAATDWGVTYHNPQVESLENSLGGIHRGLSAWNTLPANFQGVAIYSEWVTDEDEWLSFRRNWTLQPPSGGSPN